MIEDIKRAIDNNDVDKMYSYSFFMDSSIKSYINKRKKKIINDILNLRLWLDDECAVTYYNDNDFIKASIMASNIDVARLFNNDDINSFLINNMDNIINFMNKKLYVLSNKTPNVLLSNSKFIRKCLDNGFINVLDYNADNEYYLKNKKRIDDACYDKIINGIIKIDEFSSKRMLLNNNFLVASILSNNYSVLLFSRSYILDRYLENNYKLIRYGLEKYIRDNNYCLSYYNIKSSFFRGVIKRLINNDFLNKRVDNSLLSVMNNYEFNYFISYLDNSSINELFGKRIYQLYLVFGLRLFSIGYDKICIINGYSIIQFERFVKIFCFKGNIKMENVRDMYFNIIHEEFDKKSTFKVDSSINIESSIDNNGFINKKISKMIDKMKDILGESYYDHLVALISNNYNMDTNKPFGELINDCFDAYRRASNSLDNLKQEKLHIIIDSICKDAYNREFDLFASSKMDFSDSYPFLVEPSDIYIKRSYKEKKLDIIKKDILDDDKKINELCSNIYDKSIPYCSFVKNIKNYLKGKDINNNVDNYLSKYLDFVDIDNINVDYYNLPLTDEYLKVSYNSNTILNILKNIDFYKLGIELESNYDNFKELFYDKQILYMLDCFSIINSFYNFDNLCSLINNFVLIDEKNIYNTFKLSNEYIKLPSLFNDLFGDASKYIKNDYNLVKNILKRSYNILKKRYIPIPFMSKKYKVNNHEISISVGGFEYEDAFSPIMVNSNVFVNREYDDLHEYICKNENGFMIKFYDNKLIGLVYGIRYGNTIFLSNLTRIVHLSYILEPLKKFISSIVLECNRNHDNIGHVYLSNYGSIDKIYSLVNNLVCVNTDYVNNGLVIYDNLSKINSRVIKKYSIPEYILIDCDASKRANKLRLIDLFGNNEEFYLNDFVYNNYKYAGRSWYKDDEYKIIGEIDDNIINQISKIKKGL